MDYMKLPISHEHLADKLYKELNYVLEPLTLKISLHTSVRGGIYTDIHKE